MKKFLGCIFFALPQKEPQHWLRNVDAIKQLIFSAISKIQTTVFVHLMHWEIFGCFSIFTRQTFNCQAFLLHLWQWRWTAALFSPAPTQYFYCKHKLSTDLSSVLCVFRGFTDSQNFSDMKFMVEIWNKIITALGKHQSSKWLTRDVL